MTKVEDYDMPEELYYHKEHMWAKVEGDKVKMGLSDFSQKLAGEISNIEMPEEGGQVNQEKVVGRYETGKWLGKIYAPVSGEEVCVGCGACSAACSSGAMQQNNFSKRQIFEIVDTFTV